jgi:hypothetical protein
MKLTTLLAFTALVFAACSTSNKPEALKNISSFAAPIGANASLPHLTKGGDDNLYLSWVEKGDSTIVELKYAQLIDDTWSVPELIASGDNWFVNWADYPMLAVDKDGNKVAHYLAKNSSGTYSYDVNVVRKPTGTQAWLPSIVPHNDGTPTEHGFATLLPQNDGKFLLAWLDGRNTGGGEHDGHDGHEGHGGGGAMTVRSAVMDMQGNLTDETELDGKVCDCCQTTGAIVGGIPIIAFRDRSDEGMRDMSFVTKSNGQWTDSKAVSEDNWKIAGCPVNGPRLAAFEDQAVIAWFTAADGNPKVKVAFSNGNNEFDLPIVIDEKQPLGRVDVVMLDKNSAVVSWLTSKDEKTIIMAAQVNKNGEVSEARIVSETSSSRGSGFPQMEKVGNNIYFAWTHVIEKETSIKMAKMEF